MPEVRTGFLLEYKIYIMLRNQENILSRDEFIDRLNKDTALFSNELNDIEANWTTIASTAQSLLSHIPDIGVLSKQKRLLAYRVIDNKLDQLLKQNKLSENQKACVMLLLTYSSRDFEKAYNTYTEVFPLRQSRSLGSVISSDESPRTGQYDAGERVFRRIKFDYRYPMSIRIVFACFLVVILLEEFGIIHLYQAGTFFAILALFMLPIVISPYRGGFILLDRDYFEFPSLYMPPYKRIRVYYKDVLSVKNGRGNPMSTAIKTSERTYMFYDSNFKTFQDVSFRAEIKDRVNGK